MNTRYEIIYPPPRPQLTIEHIGGSSSRCVHRDAYRVTSLLPLTEEQLRALPIAQGQGWSYEDGEALKVPSKLMWQDRYTGEMKDAEGDDHIYIYHNYIVRTVTDSGD